MNQPLIVIPFTAEQAPAAERLCDWIFALSGKDTNGSCLLVAAADVHAEMIAKVSVSAEVACEHVEMIQAPETNATAPGEVVNKLFAFAGEYLVRHYRCPWVWLEPYSVPLVRDWRENLLAAYLAQPKRYLGGHWKFGSGEKLCLSPCAVYPPDAIRDLSPFCNAGVPFNVAAADSIVARSTKSRLIQGFEYAGDITKLRPDACVLSSDKTGKLIEHLHEQVSGPVEIIPPLLDLKPKMTVAERMAKARSARGKVGATQMARL